MDERVPRGRSPAARRRAPHPPGGPVRAARKRQDHRGRALGRRLGLPVLRLAPRPQDARVPCAGLLELALALQALPAARELTAELDEAAGRPGSPDDAGSALRLRRQTAAVLREAPPMTLVVDNAQWLDPASAAVLGWALRLTPDLPSSRPNAPGARRPRVTGAGRTRTRCASRP
ncbi:hypothetical protein Shyd_56760 [Streptomyces hydrogenans]|uniref:Orc1-like AAA ATPase domain-containing protein n=1 Tax=Streptomyces hydrogenans TaxID=1873719 RepID=A0ABQ3PH19_9ACTN|nr:hypothetical protein Shyd_56760 [Streptomyces hydrogenans]